jgi:ribosome maturation factor RimP
MSSVLKEKVVNIIKPELDAMGVEVVELEVSGFSGKPLVRMYIDRLGETSAKCTLKVEDCEKVTRSVQRLLDVENVFPNNYTLEVSTPGLERAVSTVSDYTRFKGKLSKVVLKQAGPDSCFTGRITDTVDNDIIFSVDGHERRVNIADIKKANLKFER